MRRKNGFCIYLINSFSFSSLNTLDVAAVCEAKVMAMNMQKLSLNASRVCEIRSRDTAEKNNNTSEIIEWNECVWWKHKREC